MKKKIQGFFRNIREKRQLRAAGWKPKSGYWWRLDHGLCTQKEALEVEQIEWLMT